MIFQRTKDTSYKKLSFFGIIFRPQVYCWQYWSIKFKLLFYWQTKEEIELRYVDCVDVLNISWLNALNHRRKTTESDIKNGCDTIQFNSYIVHPCIYAGVTGNDRDVYVHALFQKIKLRFWHFKGVGRKGKQCMYIFANGDK